MRILLTLPRPLFPADTGGKIRSLNICSRLARRAEIHAVSFAAPVSDAAAIVEMKNLFASYTPVFWQEPKKHSREFYTEVLVNQFHPLPYFLAKCNRPNFRSAVEKLMVQQRFDLLFCDFLHTAVPLLKVDFRPKVVFEHNVEFMLRMRKWQTETHPLRKMIFGAEWRKTQKIEAKVCRAFDHVITVSSNDQQIIQSKFLLNDVSALPAGVDTDFFNPMHYGQYHSRSGRHDVPPSGRLVFVGSMDWDPNEDGVLWFLREIYPQICQVMPGVNLSVVGRGASTRLRAISAQARNVEITGWVPDVRPYLAQADVAVVPLRIGGGTRIKIPEAMAMGKPVVSTPIGAEGLPFLDGREIRIAEDPKDFAATVVELLKNSSLRESIGKAAREKVTSKYGWDVVVDEMEEILERAKRSQQQTTAAA